MHRYVIINSEGIIIGEKILCKKIDEKNSILVDVDFDPTNKKWNGSGWETYEPPEPQEPEPTQLDSIEQTQLMMMEAMADQYEQRLETDLMMMDAQATTFETVLALTEGMV